MEQKPLLDAGHPRADAIKLDVMVMVLSERPAAPGASLGALTGAVLC
jgi:hypothetical protein